MTIERKTGTLKAVSEGKATIRLATLLKVDLDNDVIEPHFFPTRPLVVSIQPYHKHDVPSLGHATVWEDFAQGEILSIFEFNDSLAAIEQWKVLRWDFEHGAIQQFSWAFRPKPGSTRQGTFEGRSVRFLGPTPEGHGCDLLECSPVLRGASINSGTLEVRSAAAMCSPSQQAHFRGMHARCLQRSTVMQEIRDLEDLIAREQQAIVLQDVAGIHQAFLERERYVRQVTHRR